MIAKMNITEISDKSRKNKKIKAFIIRITPKTNVQGKVFPLKQNIKQIHKAVQALDSDRGFWRPSWILFKELKNDEKREFNNHSYNHGAEGVHLQSFFIFFSLIHLI